MVNFATLKAHAGTGVTLCGKNHFGSMVRWPVEKGYYDTHTGSFAKKTKAYREQVDLLGHSHLGGKTVLCLIDGIYSGKHPIDQAPRKWASPPFDGNWTSSLLASQDPVAIDSVGLDFLRKRAADELEPGAVEVRVSAIVISHPDHHRCAVREEPEAFFAFPQRGFPAPDVP